MKNSIIIFSIGFLFFSCSTPENKEYFNETVPYYKFSNSDSEYLLNSVYPINSIINFKNQNNEILSFKVISKEKTRKEESYGTFWGSYSSLMYYYDSQTIFLKSITENDENAFLKLEVYKGSSGNVLGGFYFYKWNGYYQGYYKNNENYNLITEPKISLQINNLTYNKVIVIDSDHTDFYTTANYTANVNKMYYDINYGIIGFDDLSNNHWRIVN